MTRFAGAENILNRIQDLENARVEGSVPYLTPYMSSQNPPSNRSAKGSYFDYVEDKRKELDDIVNSDGGPWKKPDESVDEVDPIDPADPVDPVEEIDPEKKAAQEKWKGIWANQIAEGISMDDAMRSSRTVTPEEWENYKWAFSEDTGLDNWRKIGGGNKMGSGGVAANAKRRAQAASRSGPGLGFHLGQKARDITARFSPTQGGHMESNPDYRGHR